MKILSRPRGMGKTSELLKWVLKDPDHRIMLVRSAYEKDLLTKKLAQKKLYPSKIKFQNIETWDDFINFKGWPAALKSSEGKPMELAIDNIDMFIQQFFGKYNNPVALISLSRDMPFDKWKKIYDKNKEEYNKKDTIL